MIRRSFHTQFRAAILDGIKTTTIRDKGWPVKTPIMAFSWSGQPYRSPQVDIAPIIVLGWWPVHIAHGADGSMSYDHGMGGPRALWETEGFVSAGAMDAWFRAKVLSGEQTVKFLMRFRLHK